MFFFYSSGEEDIKNIIKKSSIDNSCNTKPIIDINSEIDASNKKEYYKFKLDKNLVDKTISNLGEASKAALQQIIPHIGAGTAADAAVGAKIKSTSGLPPIQRAGAIGATAFITAATTQVGLDVGAALTKNGTIDNAIKSSVHSNPNVDRIPSPGPDAFVGSPLEDSIIDTSPLEVLLTSMFTLNIFIIILVIIFLFIIFNRFIM